MSKESEKVFVLVEIIPNGFFLNNSFGNDNQYNVKVLGVFTKKYHAESFISFHKMNNFKIIHIFETYLNPLYNK
jgi:hypothetical protein